MENTLENKAKFFAQYWGQKIVHTGSGKSMRGLGKEIAMCYENADKFQLVLFSNQRSLQLKPLSSITDEDATEVVAILKTVGVLSSAMREPQKFLEPLKKGKGTIQLILPVADYLRSKGYALPYMGLSIETLCDYGWIKLQES